METDRSRATRDARGASRAPSVEEVRASSTELEDALAALEGLRRARDAASARARAFARGRRAGVLWGASSASSGTEEEDETLATRTPPCVVACGWGQDDARSSWVAGLVPGELFYLEFDRARSFTVDYPARPETSSADGSGARTFRHVARETVRRRQLATYALGPDGGAGLCGWSPGEDPDVAFRDGTMRQGDVRFETGLCVFTSLSIEDEDDGACGSVGTLCQWIRRNMDGERSRSFVDQTGLSLRRRFACEPVPLSWASDDCLMEFRAISVVWVEFPEEVELDLHHSFAYSRSFRPSLVNFDKFFSSTAPVYSLGVHSVRESRTKEARALMSKILNLVRAEESLWIRICLVGQQCGELWSDDDIPPFAQHPSGFSYWILHVLPGAIGNEFRRLVLLTDDVYTRLSLIWLKLKLELTMPHKLVPVTHSCGYVVSFAGMMDRFKRHNCSGLSNPHTRGHIGFNDSLCKSSVDCAFSRIFGDPEGGMKRVSILACAAPRYWDDDAYPNTSPADVLTDVIDPVSTGPFDGSYTWFIGSKWRPVHCPGCREHCGFRFSVQNPSVQGVIPRSECNFFALQDVVTCWDGANEVDGVDTKDLVREYFANSAERFEWLMHEAFPNELL